MVTLQEIRRGVEPTAEGVEGTRASRNHDGARRGDFPAERARHEASKKGAARVELFEKKRVLQIGIAQVEAEQGDVPPGALGGPEKGPQFFLATNLSSHTLGPRHRIRPSTRAAVPAPIRDASK